MILRDTASIGINATGRKTLLGNITIRYQHYLGGGGVADSIPNEHRLGLITSYLKLRHDLETGLQVFK